VDEKSMLAAYAMTYGDEHDRLILADYFEERGDPRGTWLRDPELASWMGPEAANPFVKLAEALPDDSARKLLVRFGTQAVPALLAAWPGGIATWYDEERRALLADILAEIAGSVNGLTELVERLHSTDPREQCAALETLGERGEAAGPALPAILRLLHEDRGSVREAALATLERMGTLAESALLAAWGETGWNSDDEFGNYHLPIPLLDACERLGPHSRLVASIVKAMETSNDGVPERAREVLWRFGVEAFDVVLREGSLLHRGQSDVHEVLRSCPGATERLLAAAKDRQRPQQERCCALAALGPGPGEPCGPEYDWLLPHLIELLDDADSSVQRESARALRGFGERSTAAGPALLRLLAHEDDLVPYVALATLEQQGPEAARAALPLVRPLVQHSSPLVQGAARRFIARHAAAADQIDEVREALRSDAPARRRSAVPRLLGLAQQFPEVPDLFRRALADPDETVCLTAAWEIVLRQWPEGIDPEPLYREALDALLRLLKTASLRTRSRALEALAAKPLRGPEALAATCAALGGEGLLRQAAVRALRDKWRPLPAEAIPGLIHFVRTDTTHLGRGAAALLQNVYPPPADFLPALRQRLKLGDTGRWVVECLDRLGHVPSEDELPLLVPMLEDHPLVAGNAARLLARMGTPALPHLIAHLDQRNGPLLASALASMGPAARDALPALAAMIQHAHSFVRSRAVEVIAAIGTPAEIVELLRPAFRDRSGSVRGNVLRVCARLGADAGPWLPELLHLVRTEDRPEELSPGRLSSTLAHLAEHLPEVVELLRQALHEPGTARANALAALAEMGSRAAELVPELETDKVFLARMLSITRDEEK
jgi:HEAT repeat protein